MHVKYKTTRFGEITVKPEDVITFKDGILGFEKYHSFTVVDPGDQTLILWLQSLEANQVAFPMIEPQLFMAEYCPVLMPTDIQSLDLKSMTDAKAYCILTIPSDITLMSANLKAPIIVNSKKKIARQIVLQDNKLNVRQEMYADLKRAINAFTTSDDRRRTLTQPSVQAFHEKAAAALEKNLARSGASNAVMEEN